MNFGPRRMLKCLQYKTITNCVESNPTSCQKAFVQPTIGAAVGSDATFPLLSSPIKLSGSVKEDKELNETPSKSEQRPKWLWIMLNASSSKVISAFCRVN